MKKKIISLLLVGCMAATMLAGCGDSKDKGSTGNSSTNGNEEEKQEDSKNGDPYTVAIQLVNISPELSDIEKVEEAINEISLPAINCKVDIQNHFIGDLPTNTSMAVVSGEKMDIVCVGFTQKLADIADDGILMPLDDYLKYAPTYVDLVEKYMIAGQVDGVQYAIPATPYAAMGTGLIYNKDMADKYDITIKDGASFEDITAAYKTLKENDIYGTSMAQGSTLGMQFWYNIELMGTNGDYGMIVDPANSTKIENVYESDIFKEYCEQMKEWTDAGYMPADSLTDSTSVQEYLTAQKLFSTLTQYNIGQFATWGNGQPFTIDIAEIEKAVVTTSGIVEQMWGLATNSENPQKAMEFLNLIYENPDVANLLKYGIEGQNYVIVDGTERVVTAEGATTGTAGYCSVFTRFGNELEIYTGAPNTDSYAADVEAYNKDVPVSKSLGYAFDSSEFSAEAGAISNVIAEYLPRLQTGQVENVDALLTEFTKALDNAGYNDIIAANQKQLDAFLADKK